MKFQCFSSNFMILITIYNFCESWTYFQPYQRTMRRIDTLVWHKVQQVLGFVGFGALVINGEKNEENHHFIVALT